MVTVEGIIRSSTGEPIQTPLTFEKTAVTIVGDHIASATRRTKSTNAAGEFSITLEPGNWSVYWFNGEVQSRITIAVPDDDGETYDIQNIITTSLTFTYSYEPLYALQQPPNGSFRIKDGKHLQLWNPTTELWHTMIGSGEAGALQIGLAEGEA